MKNFRYRLISVCAVLVAVTVTPALSEPSPATADDLAKTFTPAQLSELIAIAAGRVSPTPDKTALMEQLGRQLDLNSDVLTALLRIIDHADIPVQFQSQNLAQSASRFRTVNGELAELRLDDANEQDRLTHAREALNTGQFSEVEAQVQQIENAEAAAAKALDEHGSDGAGGANQHRILAAQSRMLLGGLALLTLRYAEADEDFKVAQQLVESTLTAQADAIKPQTMPPESTAPTDARPAAPAPVAVAAGSDTPVKPDLPQSSPPAPERTATVVPSAPVDGHQSDNPHPMTEVVVRAHEAEQPLPAPMVDLLLRRGDALLAVGDVSSARLLYERVAAAGDPRGATGAGKTYDPHVLATIGARGLQPDPAAAAAWYRKALEHGDSDAASRLALLGQ